MESEEAASSISEVEVVKAEVICDIKSEPCTEEIIPFIGEGQVASETYIPEGIMDDVRILPVSSRFVTDGILKIEQEEQTENEDMKVNNEALERSSSRHNSKKINLRLRKSRPEEIQLEPKKSKREEVKSEVRRDSGRRDSNRDKSKASLQEVEVRHKSRTRSNDKERTRKSRRSSSIECGKLDTDRIGTRSGGDKLRSRTRLTGSRSGKERMETDLCVKQIVKTETTEELLKLEIVKAEPKEEKTKTKSSREKRKVTPRRQEKIEQHMDEAVPNLSSRKLKEDTLPEDKCKKSKDRKSIRKESLDRVGAEKTSKSNSKKGKTSTGNKEVIKSENEEETVVKEGNLDGDGDCSGAVASGASGATVESPNSEVLPVIKPESQEINIKTESIEIPDYIVEMDIVDSKCDIHCLSNKSPNTNSVKRKSKEVVSGVEPLEQSGELEVQTNGECMKDGKSKRMSFSFSNGEFDGENPLKKIKMDPLSEENAEVDSLDNEVLSKSPDFKFIKHESELFESIENTADGISTSGKPLSDVDDSSEDILKDSFKYYRGHEASCSDQKTDNLRIFQVLDECGASEDDDNYGDGSDSDISSDEIEAMLEEGLQNNKDKGKDGENGIKYTRHISHVLEELGHNHFDMLPEGWIQVTHKSGMPVYLHKQSRVCTFSRPYYLGQGSVRKHHVPLNAIPCLQYRRALEDEEEQRKKREEAEAAGGGPHSDGQYLHTAKIETTEENKLSQSLNPFSIQQYCKKLFRFKKEQRLHFFSWADRRKYGKQKKNDHRPSFPEGTKLIKFPIQNPEDGPRAKPRGEWIMNPNGKSYICILHEYVQHALKKQPTYEFKALENPSTPYSATVIINDMRYGYGTGTSKKQAKLAAAKASLEILIPEMREKIRNDNKNGKRSGSSNFPDEEETSLSIFDEIRIEDPRVAEFCAKTTEPSPYSILLTCLQRNFGIKEMPISCQVNPLHRQSNEFIMTVGKHTARVICKNKKEGKQRASQAILQDLHPHITSWGALLRLYGNRSVRNVKEKKQEEQEITMLQSKASLNSPNYSIINKLRSEMKKLHDQQSKIRPIGLFIPPEEVVLPSSGTELDKVDF